MRFDSNKYSVSDARRRPSGRGPCLRDRIVIRHDGEIVAEHARRFGRDQTVYDPWHYVPVLARKPGALRNGAPFKDWALPGAHRVACNSSFPATIDGDRQIAKILTADAVGWAGYGRGRLCPGVRMACVCSVDVVLNILNRRRQPSETAPIPTPANLQSSL